MAQQQIAPCLTIDMWAKVFAHLEDILDNEYSPVNNVQAQMHPLNLVCKQFRQTFTSHSRFVRQRNFLSHSFSDRLLPSLVAWLHKNQRSVRTVVSRCKSPLVEVVLAQLQSSQPNVKWIDVYGVSPSLLTSFSSLEICELRNTTRSVIDLEPLGCLPNLDHLGLRGQFRGLHHIKGLTRLECAWNFPVSHGVISDVRVIAPTLQHLEVNHCTLLGVNILGLSACTALTQLVFCDPCLMFDKGNVYIDQDLSLSHSNLGLLGQLHTLHLSSTEEETPSLSWISVLTSLRELNIFTGSCNSSLAEHVSWLTNLTCLEIRAATQNYDDFAPVLNIDVGWDNLQALQILSICFFRLQLGTGRGIAGLLQLPHLRELSFDGSMIDGSDNDHFTALMYNLGKLRPEVQVASGI